MKNPRINESLIIGVDFSERDNGVLIVGRQKNGEVTIIFEWAFSALLR